VLSLKIKAIAILAEDYEVSNETILKAIKKSLPISIEEGLMRTFMSFRK
jgi:hypothetical protein